MIGLGLYQPRGVALYAVKETFKLEGDVESEVKMHMDAILSHMQCLNDWKLGLDSHDLEDVNNPKNVPAIVSDYVAKLPRNLYEVFSNFHWEYMRAPFHQKTDQSNSA